MFRRVRMLALATTCIAGLCWTASTDAQWTKPIAKAGPNAAIPRPAAPNGFRVMSMNTEWWANVFLPKKVLATTRPGMDEAIVTVLKNAREQSDEENWEIARNILDVQPDIWVMQEGCEAEDLNWFNTQFLDGYFETVHVFKTNDSRGQNTGILIRPGFKVLEFREEYYKEPDRGNLNPNGDKLFARGPGFALVQAPNGRKFWVGTNHAKSKSGNSLAVAKWRLAEATRTNQIINELSKTGPKEVFFMGDMNDELNFQEFELAAGASAIEAIAGKGPGALTILTKKLSDEGAISYHGSRSKRFQSFIDHAFATPEAAKLVTGVHVFAGDLADVVSDHYPVYFDVQMP